MSQKDSKKFRWEDVQLSRAMPRGKSCHVQEIADDYERSESFRSLSFHSKRNHRSCLATWSKVRLPNGKNIFELYVHRVDYPTADHFIRYMRFNYKMSRIKAMCTALSAVWQVAIRQGRALYNPWRDLKLKGSTERDVSWTPEDVEKAISTAKELGYHTLALYILMMYDTGQRPWIDLRNLTWENINGLDTDTTTLDYVSSKTGIHMHLPLSRDVVSSLLGRDRTQRFLFTEDGGSRTTPQTIQCQFRRVKRAAQLVDNLQLRDLRRTVAIELAEAGATRDEIRAVGGWKGDSVVHRYARIRLKTAQNAQNKREQARLERLQDAVGVEAIKLEQHLAREFPSEVLGERSSTLNATAGQHSPQN